MSHLSETFWSWSGQGCQFRWDLIGDVATLTSDTNASFLWQGTLLPMFWLSLSNGEKQCIKATVQSYTGFTTEQGGTLQLQLSTLGTGTLEVVATPTGLQFTRLLIAWLEEVPAVIGLYFGAAPMIQEQRTAAPSLELPFWPNWQAEGFCIPSTKGAPVQSFFRNWDLGHATIPLGNFGPSLGTPYAAAFPRPLFCGAMGGEQGWLVFGPGTIPDGALTFEMRSTSGCLHYLYREDLWGASTESERVWNDPLRLTWSNAEAWDTYLAHFQSFPFPDIDDSIHQRSHWNSWGDFKTGLYNIRALADWTTSIQANLLCIDDLWETSDGSSIPDFERFPSFEDDLRYVKEQGLALGFWIPAGWVDAPETVGLSREDLLCGLDGMPRRVNWSMNPYLADHYCLDPASPRALEFLRQRTYKVMSLYKPELLKLDFAYGLPSPLVAVSRDPALRGERMGYILLQTIVNAAREINPDVTVQYYGIHPLMRPVTNLIALDDLGDTGSQEIEGHQQWSIWSALAAVQGFAITASSGYDWASDSEILLDAAIIGSPGAVLSRKLKDGSPVPPECITPRQALSRWYRRKAGWTPLWLNSNKGKIGKEPSLSCWGRLERIANEEILTSLVLREKNKETLDPQALRHMQWSGRWALIAQDNQSIFHSRLLACIPFAGSFLSLPREKPPTSMSLVFAEHEQPFEHWHWADGFVQLHLPEDAAQKGILGLLVLDEEGKN